MKIIYSCKMKKNYNIDEDLYKAAINSYDFVFKASSGILDNFLPKAETYENPKISVVIPMFNIENFISRAIFSILNQNFSQFEIIVVNDFSTDNSFNITNKLSINEKRIKILNNRMKMGTLYSRCLGTIFSKGQYIFPLDGDDLFLNNDTFLNIFEETKKTTSKIDIS